MKQRIEIENQGNPFDPRFLISLGNITERYNVHVDEDTQQLIEQARRVNQKDKLNREEFLKKTKELAERMGSIKSDSVDDIRAMRDRL